jgi:hypothetical protein
MITPENTKTLINIFGQKSVGLINAIEDAKKRWRHQRNLLLNNDLL